MANKTKKHIIGIMWQKKFGDDSDISFAITSTSYKTLTSTYKFTVECIHSLNTELLIVALYNENSNLIDVNLIECDGDNEYVTSFPYNEDVAFAKVLVWQKENNPKPLAQNEIVNMR